MKTPDSFPPVTPRANPQQPATTLTLARKDPHETRRALRLELVDLSDVNRPRRELQQAELVVLVEAGGERKVLKSRLPAPFLVGGAQ